jgi:hypothetical protein
MVRIAGIFLISVFAFTESAQMISISGKVSNKSGKPIASAIVKLANQKIADTTDSQGAFSLSKTSIMRNFKPIMLGAEKISMINGVLVISLTQPTAVGVEMFDLKGNLLEKIFNNNASSGDYRFDVTARPLAVKIMLIRVSIGQHSSTFRYLPLTSGMQSMSLPASVASKGSLSKIQATVDSLKASASGYASNQVAISSYEGVVNITLDTLGLAKFSFFVTSLKGLRELSKSVNGFGGDLRFGRTGQGAGLLGADSICQCLAEKSMPGSRAKIWRAFLSVSKDANGQQVNAIDRIGQGPWYDRIGRMVAKTKADLLQNRPVGIDAAIKDDLPNENGVPNHQPDPNQQVVDNHLTITGSDSLGKLFSANATCQDWISNTDTTSKPRSGLSWTRTGGFFGGNGVGKKSGIAMSGGFFPPWDTSGTQMMTNMYNWISVWNLPGCLAGVDSLESTMAGARGDKTIGAGGGYGGFYCFALNP